MYKTIYITYDEEQYEVRFSGHVIERIIYYPNNSLIPTYPNLEQLEPELQNIIIDAILTYAPSNVEL